MCPPALYCARWADSVSQPLDFATWKPRVKGRGKPAALARANNSLLAPAKKRDMSRVFAM